VAAVGGPGRGPLAELIAEYEDRAARYFDLETVEVAPGGAGLSPKARMEEEAAALLRRVPEELDLFALTRKGKGLTSTGLARFLERASTYGAAGAAFVIGGAHGLAPSLLGAADHRMSLSPMTLPHGLARLVLAEQLYRAGTILRGEPYHKGG